MDKYFQVVKDWALARPTWQWGVVLFVVGVLLGVAVR